MPWVIAIMMFLTVLAAAGGLALNQGMRSLRSELSGRATVQIVEADAETRAQAVKKMVARLRVTPVDPTTLLPVPEGEAGLARFIDLGNVDSAVSVVTQDLVRRVSGGIQLLGRQPGAPPRGCSLAIEALLHG
jgi:hypothetical protein